MSAAVRKRRRRLLIPLVLVVAVIAIVQTDWLGRTMYPIYYKDEIRSTASRFQLDPLLVAAIIRVESNYRAEAVSPKGALGIMQVMPDTANWILEKEAEFGALTVQEIGRNPEAGMQVGGWYIREMLRQFDGNLAASLAAYNAGPGKVRQWLNEGVWDGSQQSINDIPYGETRHYVQRIFYYYNKYQQLYDEL
ncbi:MULTISPECIES: lytic transglycosylase domain-containing protein [Cohnella]|uniref:lytic transglycosylase domain-containing protein n=1 Tax=Cohnella TaxID=329857 RepID=UPI0009BC40C0|nr:MULTISPECIES: lytic transglycosylase domain-containing protein [Cohnella]MBN2982988.1 lytic transglycosylase domain-containing protein [Cohnella algarum]